MTETLPAEDDAGRRRAIIEDVSPAVAGPYPAKRVVGEPVTVEADLFADGHEAVRGVLHYRAAPDEGRAGAGDDDAGWHEVPLVPLVNDRWRASFIPDTIGMWEFHVVGWVDPWTGWRRDMEKWVAAGREITLHLEIGAVLVDAAAARADASGDRADARTLRELATDMREGKGRARTRALRALAEEVAELMFRHTDRSRATRFPSPDAHGIDAMEVWVDRPRARFSAWYEFFPRSTGPDGEHGTFETAKAMLPYVAELGFDIVYLPPIHPIGRTNRKGKNNARRALRDDVGSPWAIGAEEGGHTAVHPELGTLEDFRGFVAAAEEHGLEVALDIAFQASPDHPWAREHPDWFRHRPDGSIAYAENPPKKYEDIYPLDFETEDWRGLWTELKGVFEFWIRQGVRIFRVDNPHTKAFPFWEWCIAELRGEHPDLIFLSEAFTRPKVMNRLAKLGFTQSYTYFAWRNARWELEQYLLELTQRPRKEFFRSSFWPNTPDILTETLQTGGRPAFMARLVLAATMAASYGIYGPAFELMEHRPREEGSEEYLDSEKYQLRDWDLDRADSLRDFIARVNAIRASNPALHRNDGVRVHETKNEHLIAYSKRSPDGSNTILTVVNLDPRHPHAGQLEVPLEDWGFQEDESFLVHDLLGDVSYTWRGRRHYIELNPHAVPAHIFRLERPRNETDRDAYGEGGRQGRPAARPAASDQHDEGG